MEKRVPQNNRIRAIQAELNISDQEMADTLGVQVAYYRAKLNGHKPWTREDIETIQALSKKSFDYIYGM